jgi:glycosyltransferase involved in cell wall biosynthesis
MTTFSAIMPTYNQAAYIGEAVDSVFPQVDEFILVDDGSTDGTADIVAATVTLAANHGTANAINQGFAKTTGDWVTWVSSDNTHTPNWRAKLEESFADDVGVVYSAFRFGIGGKVLHTPYDRRRLIGQENCYFGPSFAIRRDVWLKAISHDYDHWLRVEEACWAMGLRIVSIPDALCDYRVHDERATVVRKHQYDAHVWQAKALERRAAKC